MYVSISYRVDTGILHPNTAKLTDTVGTPVGLRGVFEGDWLGFDVGCE